MHTLTLMAAWGWGWGPQHCGWPGLERCGGSNVGAVLCSAWHAFPAPVSLDLKALCSLNPNLNPNCNANPKRNGSLGLRSPAPWLALIRKVWREQCLCSAMLHLACFFQLHRPSNSIPSLCVSLNPNPNPNGGFMLRLRSPWGWLPKFKTCGGGNVRAVLCSPWHAFSSPSVTGVVGFVSL